MYCNSQYSFTTQHAIRYSLNIAKVPGGIKNSVGVLKSVRRKVLPLLCKRMDQAWMTTKI